MNSDSQELLKDCEYNQPYANLLDKSKYTRTQAPLYELENLKQTSPFATDHVTLFFLHHLKSHGCAILYAFQELVYNLYNTYSQIMDSMNLNNTLRIILWVQKILAALF
ncbi:Hypothetical_protein [Hexamita inflata]|uniref:Hypothetical_protein n=1 Tax=Hexamita inflata TaxID=28002 RepID=A0AA86V3Z3_9EUKA|nr:Hypothetical protein HINF_LOCUS63211 [Hexamita inflata]